MLENPRDARLRDGAPDRFGAERGEELAAGVGAVEGEGDGGVADHGLQHPCIATPNARDARVRRQDCCKNTIWQHHTLACAITHSIAVVTFKQHGVCRYKSSIFFGR